MSAGVTHRSTMSVAMTIALRGGREVLRDHRFVVVAVALLLLAIPAFMAGVAEQTRHAADRSAATDADREIWQTQGEVNPHSAAHFGMIAFKPRASLALFDPGLSAWLGEAVWLEAHYQNPPEARPAAHGLMLQRFGTLSPAWILQLLLPLLVILAGFATLAGERERGGLRLQLLQGARGSHLLIGKSLVLLTVAGVPLLALLAGSGLAAFAVGDAAPDTAQRWSWLFTAYALYALIWIALTLAVSGLMHRSRQALFVLLTLWTFSAVLVPRFAAGIAEAAYPDTAAGDFWAEVRRARAEGVDGHDPGNERTEALRARVLEAYGVDSVDELPLDFDGIALQVDEEYGNTVFDHYYGSLASMEQGRLQVLRWFTMLSPSLALQTLSATASGTDITHQQHFTHSAETHRRQVQRVLNTEQMLHGRGLYFTNMSDDDFWKTVPLFSYNVPAIADVPGAAARLRLDALILAMWGALGMLASVLVVRRLERTG